MAWRIRTAVGRRRDSNVLHFIPPGGFTGSDLDHFQELMARWWYTGSPTDTTHYPAKYVSHDASFLDVGLRFISQFDPFLYFAPIIQDIEHDAEFVSPPLPPGVTYVLTIKTRGPFRRGDGRVFLPGVPVAAVDSDDANFVDKGYRDDVVTAWNNLLEGGDPETVVGAGFIPVVWLHSRQVGGPDAMPVVQPIVSFRGSAPRMCVLPRRLPQHLPELRPAVVG